MALGLGLAACEKGLSVGFITAAALVHELIEARDDKQLLARRWFDSDELGRAAVEDRRRAVVRGQPTIERGSTLISALRRMDRGVPSSAS